MFEREKYTMSKMIPFNNAILLIFFLYCFSTTPVICLNNETDFQSLFAFKKAIVSDPQGSLYSWNETLHFCSWKGIFCSKTHLGRVIEIDLMSQGLVGPLSPHIGNLSLLRNINLRNNTFSGPIPNEIGRLRRLERIEFSNNSFSGEIPRNLSQCTNVVYLNLIDNKLTGIIIPELVYMLNLESLGLALNHFSGTIPPFIGNLTRLIRLSLAYNEFEGQIPESLSQLQSLALLRLSVNNLTGRIPNALYNISTLDLFQVAFNQLHGTLPSGIGFNFPRLTFLHLGHNHFTGVIPASLSNSSLLEFLDVVSNNFSKIVTDFSRISALQYFFADYNQLEGNLDFLSSMSNSTVLSMIDISRNSLSGTLQNSIFNISSQLRFLSLAANQLHGNIPSTIGNLLGLTTLDISNNDFEGPIPSEIGKLNMLQTIYLGGNMLTHEIPSSFGNLSLLNLLSLEMNNISGSIPQNLGNCTNLSYLNLTRNNISGLIPHEILSLSSLSIGFDLSHNALTGPIPSAIGSLVHLANLDLSHNKLSGQIPNMLSQCTQLGQLHLDNNLFSGQIPNALQSLRGIAYLDLSENNFSGHIPSFLGDLKLVYLNLSYNMLQGEVPIQGVFGNESIVFLQGNNELCGGSGFLKLPSCSPSVSKKKHTSPLPQILIPIGVVVICVLFSTCCFYIFIYKKKVLRNIEPATHSSMAQVLRLSYADLLNATRGFSKENLLGVGGFGSVYKGILEGVHFSIAVKVIDLSTEGGSKSFVSECIALKDIRHRNLMKILSVCSSTDFQGNNFKALVYEFMANGNLDDWLHQNLDEETQQTGERRSLSLRQRLTIVVDVACAIEYLHNGTESTIVHGDLKPSNILLDENMMAHVGDFGLAKVLNKISPHHESNSIGIKGTIGYIPPEYGASGILSTEGDVFSFGILLLEIFSGRRPTDDSFGTHLTVRNFVTSYTSLPGQVLDVLDPLILNEKDYKMDVNFKSCITSLLDVGLTCSAEVPRDRMQMGDVANELQKIITAFERST